MTVPEYRPSSRSPPPPKLPIPQIHPIPYSAGSPLPLVWTPLQRLYLMNDFLSSHLNEYGDASFWQKWVGEFFAPEATLSLSLPNDMEDPLTSSLVSNTSPSPSTSPTTSFAGSDTPKTVTIHRALIPRFFLIWAQSGMCRVGLQVERIKEMMLPNGNLLLDSVQCRLLSHLDGGLQVVEHSGPARFLFGGHSKILYLELNLTSFEHFISSRSQCLFTLPLKSGFDQSVHQFFDLQTMVQASTRMPGSQGFQANTHGSQGFQANTHGSQGFQANTQSQFKPPFTQIRQPKPNHPYHHPFINQAFPPKLSPYPPILPNAVTTAVSPGARLKGSARGKKPRSQAGNEENQPTAITNVLKFEEYQPPVAKEPKGSETQSCS